MKLVGGDFKRFVVRPEELRKMFASLKGAKSHIIWSWLCVGCCPSELTFLKPEDVNCEKVGE